MNEPAEKTPSTPPRSLLRRTVFDRTYGTILLSIAMVLLLGRFRNDGYSGMSPRVFWVKKFDWKHCADMVVAGDSRTGEGLSPALMSPELGDARIRNFSFNSLAWSQPYFDSLENVLDPHSKRRAVVLGITPHSCTFLPSKSNGWHVEGKKAAERTAMDRKFESALSYFDPMSVKNALRRMVGIKARHLLHRHHCEDGWTGTDRLRKVNPELWLNQFRRLFRENKVSDVVIARVIDRTRRWRQAGIEVYAFRPPTTAKMVELEEVHSGFEEKVHSGVKEETRFTIFKRKFLAAGGVWIDVSQTDYHSHDGSHLSRPAAEQLSRDLAKAIHRHRTGATPAGSTRATSPASRPGDGSP